MRKKGWRGAVSAWVDCRIILVLAAFAALAAGAYSAAPSWWASRSIHNGKAANDYAVVNQGQLKNMVKAARDELVAKGHFLSTDSNAINNMVNSWSASTDRAQDYAPVNLGQLKAVAVPFYDKLQLPYPWATPTTPGTTDYAVANLGQLKNVFAFEINVSVTDDDDGDGISDGWEVANFGSLTRDMGLDADGDGVSDYDEWVAGTDPRDWRSHPGSSNEAMVQLSVYTSMIQ